VTTQQLSASIGAGIERLGLPAELAPPLAAYLTELEKWNKAYNLTAVRDVEEMVTRHLLDALAVLPLIDARAARLPPAEIRLLDVGSGAGLPGIPLAVARPPWRLTLLDSNGKKSRFQRHAVRTLGLSNVEVVEARAEAWQPPRPFPLIISRAFASLADFVSLTGHLLAGDGRWLAMKGKVAPDELESLPPGMSIESVYPVTVPGLREARSVVVVRRA
jgi:16S rRNA (guanine527-N7)-methyltransferase